MEQQVPSLFILTFQPNGFMLPKIREKKVENVFLKIPLRFTKIAARNERIHGSKEKNAAPVI